MNDVFARIGLALSHLLNQSSVNGPQKEEVHRLAEELQRFEGSINEIVNARIAAALEGIEGRLTVHVDSNFEQLAQVLETSDISFTPTPAPAPAVIAAPADEPVVVEAPPAEPAPVTGNIPAPVSLEDAAANAEAAAQAEPVEQTTGNAPAPVEPPAEPVVDAPVVPEPEVAAEPVVEEAPPATEEAPAAEPVEADVLTEDPDLMTVKVASDWLDAHKIDRAGVTRRDDLRGLVRMAQEQAAAEAGKANSPENTTVIVGDGAADNAGVS